MPAPRPAVIVLLLVLVAIVVFFIVGQGLGAQQPPTLNKDEIDSLKERVFGKKEVRVSWPQGDRCPTVSPGLPCKLPVPPGKEFLRTVVVTTQDLMKIEFKPASTPDRTISLDMTDPKNRGKPAKLMVDGKGGDLSLICVTPLHDPPCTMTVE